MRKILRLLVALSLMILMLPPALQAQQRTISGTVLSDDNKTPLSGVTVRVKGTRRITQTDANGKFTIQAAAGETLQFSYVGYQPQDAKVGAGASVGISLKLTDNTIGEVVVTAMDIKRSARELGYSAQTLTGKDISETQRENFLNSLQGRVAGLTITPTTGLAGASSAIVLRGFNSLTGNNQPLFIVDGIILDNSTLNENSNGGSGLGLASDRPNKTSDYTNRIADLNPNDIEAITVLKGPEATALYGSQASSGAIVITTRKATTGKISLSYDNSFRAIKITRYNDLNNEFSPGTNGIGGNLFNTGSGSYYGPKYPANIPRFDNINHFFQTGFAQTHNLNADFGFKDVGFKITGSYFTNKGVVPTNEYKKYNVRITNTTKIGKMIEITPSFQYIHSINDKPLKSYGGYLLGLYIWPVNRDIRQYADVNGNKLSVYANANNPFAEIDNPLFNVNRNHGQDITDRYIYTASVNITPFTWLSIAGRFGLDIYNTSGYQFQHPLSYIGTLDYNNTSSTARLGSLDNFWRKYNGYNHTITATVKKDLGKFSGRLMVGTMWQDYETKMFAIYGTKLVDSVGSNGSMYKNGQIITESNFSQVVGSPKDSSITSPGSRVRLLRNYYGQYNLYQNRQLAYFGEVSINYNKVVYLSYTHRFETSSLFPKDFRNYDYPAYSVSVILSDLLPAMKGKILNYWKIRGSRASTARAPEPYKNQSVFVNNLTSSTVGPIYNYGFDNNNPFLQPERQKTYELGTEVRFFNSRLSFDVAYYNTLCTDQIQNQYRASYGTGFILNTSNAASSRNEGVEVVADVVPVRNRNFSWNFRLNFNHTWSQILTLPKSIAYEAYIADTWLYNNARGGMIRGLPATTITGFHYMRNTAGQILISPATGIPVVEATYTVIGDRMPDFTTGFQNNFRYKNWSLNFVWDLKVGGDIFDGTDEYLTYQGKSKRTADRMTPRVVKGVLQDGLENSTNPTVNTIVVIPYYQQTYYTTMPEEEFIERNVNWFRLRDITLSYNLPDRMIKRMKFFKSAGIFFTGNDLVLFSNYRGADPLVNGNNASNNGVGGMGIDFGGLPAPVSLNFGIKATFK